MANREPLTREGVRECMNLTLFGRKSRGVAFDELRTCAPELVRALARSEADPPTRHDAEVAEQAIDEEVTNLADAHAMNALRRLCFDGTPKHARMRGAAKAIGLGEQTFRKMYARP